MSTINQKPNILCVDDEARILNSLRALLRLKYNVHVALSAAEAIEIMKNHNIAVVISDQRMPQMTGVEFLKITKQLSPHSIRILLTGFSDLEAIVNSVNESEVYRFLTKPWGNKQLLTIVEEAVEASLTLQEAKSAKNLAPASFAKPTSVIQSGFSTTHVLVPPDMSDAVRISASEAIAAKGSELSYIICQCVEADELNQLNAWLTTELALNVRLLKSSTSEETMEYLRLYPVKLLVVYLTTDQSYLDLLRLLKRELPQLLTIGIAEFSDYEELIDLINEVKLYRYLVKPVKVNKIGYFIQSAMIQYDQIMENPALLREQTVVRDKPINIQTQSLFDRIKSFLNFR